MLLPLRPDLYRRLEARLGPVVIGEEGGAFEGYVAWNPVKKRHELQATIPGEYYLVNCPFCSDTRHRLWINHRWGLYVPQLKSDNLWLAHCYNENCLSVPGRAWELKQFLFNDVRSCHQLDLVPPGTVLSQKKIQPARSPGYILRLDQLLFDHPACVYLRQRGFDPIWLSERLQVGYCHRADDWCRLAQNCLIVPVFHKKALVGWQARFVGEPHSKDIPKYRTMPGMPRRELLYNLDEARSYPYVVVCEGVTGVWRFGPEAVALFGKSASVEQRQLLRAFWKEGVVNFLLDPDAGTEARKIADAATANAQDQGVDWKPLA